MNQLKKKSRRWFIERLEARRCLAALLFDTHDIASADVHHPFQPVAADVDVDGDLDIIVNEQFGDKLVLFENLGGKLAGAQVVLHQEWVWPFFGVAIGDLNADGHPDLVWSASVSNQDSLVWQPGLGTDFEFGAPKVISKVWQSLQLGDFDRDGDLDIVTGGQPRWFENSDGRGTFLERRITLTNDTGMDPWTTEVADLDGDADLDIILHTSGKMAWLENSDGRGTFLVHTIPQRQGTYVYYVAAVDLDGDRDRELVATDGRGSIVAQSFDQELGEFGSSAALLPRKDIFGPLYTLFDVDGDGYSDIILTTESSPNRRQVNLVWHRNLGNGTFGPSATIATQMEEVGRLGSADLNGDGHLELIVTTLQDNQVSWFVYDRNATAFGDRRLAGSGNVGAEHVRSGDLDSDGISDLAVVSYDGFEVAWIKGLGHGTFGERTVIDKVTIANSITITDLDSDGDGDIIVASLQGLHWYENVDGQGNWSRAKSIGDISWATVIPGDLDADGDMDIMAYQNVNDSTLIVYKNRDGHGAFSSERLESLGGAIDKLSSAVLVDLDKDGDQDIVAMLSKVLYGAVVWYENTGGTFRASDTLVDGELLSSIRRVAANDIDDDGDVDLLLYDWWYDRLEWIENQSDIGFGGVLKRHTIGYFGAYVDSARDFDFVDLDQDGDRDIVSWTTKCAECGNQAIAWIENTGSGKFASSVALESSSHDRWSIDISDLDDDGDIDVIAATGDTHELKWLENPVRLVGDVNRDGLFDSADLLAVFQAGLFEDTSNRSTTYEQGDWNGDNRFTTADLVFAFQQGRFHS